MAVRPNTSGFNCMKLDLSQTERGQNNTECAVQWKSKLPSLGKYQDTFEGFLRRHKGQEEVEFHVKRVEGEFSLPCFVL